MFGWPQSNEAPPLPPLTSSGLRGLHESGQDDGGVHRPSASHPPLANSVAIIDLWADVDSTFDNYPYPKTGATSGCFDLIQRFIFRVLN